MLTILTLKSVRSGPLEANFYRPGAKTKSYSVSLKSDVHNEQIAFQEAEYYKEEAKHRYKIEAKKSELKDGPLT